MLPIEAPTLTIVPTYAPTARQAEAHACPATWTLFGGAEGGGKTAWLVRECIQLMLEYDGIEGVLGRYDYNDVMSPTQAYDVFHRCCPAELLQRSTEFRSPPAWCRFPNGSRITFTGFKDYLASAEFGFAAVDQAEEVPAETLRLLRGRVRQRLPNGKFPHFRMLLTCNPHPAMEWFLEEVRKPVTSPERPLYSMQPNGSPQTDTNGHPDTFAFVTALPSDNPYLPPGFVAQRRSSYTDDQFRRLIEGKWDVFAGQALSEFDRNIHVVPPFSDWRTARWPVYRGIDWGLSAPTVCEWVAVSPDGDWYIVQEYERANEVPAANAKAIAAMSLDINIGGTWIDPRTAQAKADLTHSVTWSVQQEFGRHGVYAQLAQGTREARLAAWKQALKLDPARRNPRTMMTPAPRLYIFDTCQRLIHELPRLQYREAMQGYADDIVKTEDHAYDAGGFVLASLLARGESTGGGSRSFLRRR